MPGRATTKAKAKAGAKRKARGRARVQKANTRKRARQTALQDINTLAREVGARPVPVKSATCDEVEVLVRVLQRRFATAEQAPRLREPVQVWLSNGGRFSVPLEDAVAPDLDAPAVARHRLLLPGYRLQSKAFMLTYNSALFTKDDWAAFRDFIQDLHGRFGSRAWAACLEQSEEPGRVHFHAYFFWGDGVGVRKRNTDAFVFKDTRPRVDLCRAGAADTLNRPGALHGLWYVSVEKAGTMQTDTNFAAWRKYTPKAKWLEGLWADHKLTHDQYLALSTQFRMGHGKRKQARAR